MKPSEQVDFPEQEQSSMRCLELHQSLPETAADLSPRRTLGSLKHLVLAMGDSFNDELEDFAEYGPLEPGDSPASEAC